MYLPALARHPQARVTAVCGRSQERAADLARRWSIPHVFTDAEAMLDSGLFAAVIIASPNDTHHPFAMAALERGLHVLCEKPLALTYAQAMEMAAAADRQGVKTFVPFTYRYMPTARYLRALLDEGYIGRPYHLNMRYYTGFGRSGDRFNWRFDVSRSGSGALGDIGSHFIYLATWYFGPVAAVSCRLGRMVDRPPLDPAGSPYEVADDSALLTLEFASGAHGSIHASTLAYEDTNFGQTHHMEFHGSGGTLYHFIDWDQTQRVSGARVGEGAVKELAVPEHFWGGARRDTVHNTYKDVFREQDWMIRQFVSALARGEAVRPDFHDGAAVQRILEAAALSDRERRWVDIEEIQHP